LKIVMTGSAADSPLWQQHIRTKERREKLADRMRDPNDEMKLAIVRDMWLTGFDVPCLHTMYLDKPMKGHGLMQAIARVNRVYKDKPGGLIVDYLGIALQLKEALAYYSESDRLETAIPQDEAVAVMLEKYEVVKALFGKFDYRRYFTSSAAEQTQIITIAIDYLLGLEDGKKRYFQAVAELSKAFSLSVPHEEALKIRDEVGLFQVIRAGIAKIEPVSGPTDTDYGMAIKQIVSKAVVSDKVIDIYSATGIKTPTIDIFSDQFMEEVKDMPQKNVALELLRKLLNDEIKSMMRRNLVKSRSFADMLEKTILKYQNRTIEAAQVILELLELAKKMKMEKEEGKKLGLSEDEIAFYDALCVNESAIAELGDKTLKQMARELVKCFGKTPRLIGPSKKMSRHACGCMSRNFCVNITIHPISKKVRPKRFWNRPICFAKTGAGGN